MIIVGAVDTCLYTHLKKDLNFVRYCYCAFQPAHKARPTLKQRLLRATAAPEARACRAILRDKIYGNRVGAGA